ncbi:5,6-dimethylbenzimidazole synthase [Kribbella turkmenica]|uniref:5,6-dimethylbenzimidazole synthase n=1 Tax=Kribbella turkmenica TaxID=2530375 RepID=A0A4R4WUE8_9ACTN|nr:5,6-dimethylbenzimidazole synthase [Kribbella turkmenica]TDD21271.1 5,6-dimethylbenzimidazole synthase [Kribbella turkmenica]
MKLVVGVGLRSGTSYRELRDLVDATVAAAGGGDVRVVVTVEGRETEPGLQRLAAFLDAELHTTPVSELARHPAPTPGPRVERLTGTPSVAESAVLATGAELVVPKRRSVNATAAVGRMAAAPGYPPTERDVVHRVIAERRDVRRGFVDRPIADDVLTRVLESAHRAPSVGLSQPWDFVLIRDLATRRKIHDLAGAQRDAFAASLPPDRRQAFDGLKIEAILDTPLNIAVTCDAGRGGRHVLGRHADPRTTWFSAAIAIQNLWLAARAEGLGVGWVSFFEPGEVAAVLDLPAHIELVGYLCVGHVEEFAAAPELVRTGWAARRPLAWAVHHEQWGQRGVTSIEHDAARAGENAVRAVGRQRVRVIVGGDPADYLDHADALVVHLGADKPIADFGVLWRPARTPVEAVELGVEVARDLALQGVGHLALQTVEQSEVADGLVRGLRAGARACGVDWSG